MPEEDSSKYFMVSLLIQQLYREILAVADENGGKLKNRVVFYSIANKGMIRVDIIEMESKITTRVFFMINSPFLLCNIENYFRLSF